MFHELKMWMPSLSCQQFDDYERGDFSGLFSSSIVSPEESELADPASFVKSAQEIVVDVSGRGEWSPIEMGAQSQRKLERISNFN